MSKYINDGCFEEVYEGIPYDLDTKFRVKQALFDGSSKYQDILIFESENFGRVLALDGLLQMSTADEFAYHEMIAFTALSSHENPRKVLVVGGGDGGMVKQILKFHTVERVDLCDIDKMVIDQCKKHLPDLASSFDHDKCHVTIDDAFSFLTTCKQDAYDVIICDATDPGGSDLSSALFGKEFYLQANRVLTKNGIIASQSGGSMWQFCKNQKQLINMSKEIFPSVNASYISVPAFSCCQNSFIICSKDINQDFSNPYWKFTDEKLDEMELLYYNTDLHKSCFKLPRFVKKFLFESITEDDSLSKDKEFTPDQYRKMLRRKKASKYNDK